MLLFFAEFTASFYFLIPAHFFVFIILSISSLIESGNTGIILISGSAFLNNSEIFLPKISFRILPEYS